MQQPDDDDPIEERLDHPTPAGGVYSVAQYRDDSGAPCPKSRATRVTFLEYDADDKVLASTSGRIGPT